MSGLKITLIQTPLFWEDIDKNIKMYSRKFENIKGKTDLILLPEMFTTGFTMNAKMLAENMNGRTTGFMKQYSKKLKAYIGGSIIIKSGEKYFNRLILCSPGGEIKSYDKRHLFSMGKEDTVYTEGKKHLIVKIKGWRIAFFICYDLRFPVWCRNKNNYDVAVFSANWPMERNYYWRNLLLARAIENQCYVIGVNGIGRDGNGYEIAGDSAVIDPMGKYVVNAKNKAGVYNTELNKNFLENFRKKFPVYKDADKFKIIL
jgi:omega-amidase